MLTFRPHRCQALGPVHKKEQVQVVPAPMAALTGRDLVIMTLQWIRYIDTNDTISDNSAPDLEEHDAQGYELENMCRRDTGAPCHVSHIAP